VFSREFWHPKTTDPAELESFGKRLSRTIRLDANTLQPEPMLEAGGRRDFLEKFGLAGKQLRVRSTEKEILTYLDTVFKKLARAGWIETEESLSYRVFVHRDKPPGKFWNIRLSGTRCEIYSGKAENKRGRLLPNSGKNTDKDFPTRELALAAYHKMIGEKLRKGYVELHPRETAYSATTTQPTSTKSKRK